MVKSSNPSPSTINWKSIHNYITIISQLVCGLLSNSSQLCTLALINPGSWSVMIPISSFLTHCILHYCNIASVFTIHSIAFPSSLFLFLNLGRVDNQTAAADSEYAGVRRNEEKWVMARSKKRTFRLTFLCIGIRSDTVCYVCTFECLESWGRG